MLAVRLLTRDAHVIRQLTSEGEGEEHHVSQPISALKSHYLLQRIQEQTFRNQSAIVFASPVRIFSMSWQFEHYMTTSTDNNRGRANMDARIESFPDAFAQFIFIVLFRWSFLAMNEDAQAVVTATLTRQSLTSQAFCVSVSHGSASQKRRCIMGPTIRSPVIPLLRPKQQLARLERRGHRHTQHTHSNTACQDRSGSDWTGYIQPVQLSKDHLDWTSYFRGSPATSRWT